MQVSCALTLEECQHNKWAFGPVCNVISEVVTLPTPVPHKGALSTWPIADEALAQVRKQLATAPVRSNDLSKLPSASAVPKRPAKQMTVRGGGYNGDPALGAPEAAAQKAQQDEPATEAAPSTATSALQAPAAGERPLPAISALQAAAAGERPLRRPAPRPARRRPTWPTATLPKRPQARAPSLTLRRPLSQLEHRAESRLRPPPPRSKRLTSVSDP